jgi:hypothetical protein
MAGRAAQSGRSWRTRATPVYAVFGRWAKHETLLHPDDVAAGHAVRFRRASADRVVRSRQPAHPRIVSVEEFIQPQLLRRSRAAGGMRGIAKLERTRTTGTRPYLLRGLMRCGICGRRMQGAVIRKQHTYYRCLARTLAPGSAALADHPKTVNLREDDVLEPLNGWIGHLFGSENVDRTVAALISSQAETTAASNSQGAMKKRLAEPRRGYGDTRPLSRQGLIQRRWWRRSTKRRHSWPPHRPSWKAHPRRMN